MLQINELYDGDFGVWVLKILGQDPAGYATLFRLEKDKMGILMTNVLEADAEASTIRFRASDKIGKWETIPSGIGDTSRMLRTERRFRLGSFVLIFGLCIAKGRE